MIITREGRRVTVAEAEAGDPSWPPPRWVEYVRVMSDEALKYHARPGQFCAPAARAELARRGRSVRSAGTLCQGLQPGVTFTAESDRGRDDRRCPDRARPGS